MTLVESSSDELVALVRSLSSVQMDEYAVVGSYMRFGEQVREQLKDARVRIAEACTQPAKRRDNHLLWAAPGSGKTYFVEQVAASLPAITYAELNLAKLAEADFREGLVQAIAGGPTVCLIDEVDAKPEEPWPYEALMPFLDVNLERGGGIVFVLAGSSGSTIADFKERIRARPKGTDVLSRVPEANGWEIAPMDAGDRILVALSQMLNAASELGRLISGVEKLALHYLASAPHLANARQLREFSVRAVERGSASNDRIRYDDLFDSGDPENKAYWASVMPTADALVNSFVAIRDGQRGGRDGSARRLTEPRTNLPTPPTPFLGREHELEDLVALIVGDDARLVTLTGPGGTGKTRVAIEAARRSAERFPDGVFWVPLAPLRDPGLVLATVAEVMEFREQAGKTPLESLAAALAGKRMLLVLDNAEHLLPALASDVAALGAAVPALTLVVTSRERLRIAREHAFPVPTLADEDAVRLFHARARAVDPTFSSNGAVRQLCERLDNLPLALELAAARTGLLSPEQLLERLSGRLDVLTGERDADPRQQTLRATIAWSHDLLSADEQQAFARMSVFAGGCTLGAAEEICESDLDTLQSLLDKSLIRRREAESEPRLWMLETIREFAAEQLAASGEAERIARRHLTYYVAVVEGVDERRKVGEYELGPIEEERDNLRSAFDTAIALDPEQALGLAARLGLYWNRRGLYREGRQRLAAALAAAPAARASARARALSEAGNLAFWQADLDDAEQLGREALALAREHGDRSGSGYALNLLGMIADQRGDLDGQGVELYEESLAEYEAAGDEAGRLVPLQNLASNALARGDTERAISLLRERVAGTRGRDTYSLALAIGLLGFALAANGESEEARQSFEESLEVCRVHGFSRAEAEVLGGLADLMRTTSPARALEYYRESIELAWEMGYLALVVECLRGIAAIALASGDARDAATLLGVFAGFVERIGAIVAPREQAELDAMIAQTREALGKDAFEVAWADGGGLSVDQAVDLALSLTVD